MAFSLACVKCGVDGELVGVELVQRTHAHLFRQHQFYFLRDQALDGFGLVSNDKLVTFGCVSLGILVCAHGLVIMLCVQQESGGWDDLRSTLTCTFKNL